MKLKDVKNELCYKEAYNDYVKSMKIQIIDDVQSDKSLIKKKNDILALMSGGMSSSLQCKKLGQSLSELLFNAIDKKEKETKILSFEEWLKDNEKH